MAAANIQIAVSDDLIYEQWAPIAKKRLVDSGVWDVVVSGVPPDPRRFPELAETIKVADLAQWRNLAIKDIKALKILHASLPDSTFRKTFTVESAKDLWEMLKIGNDEAKHPRLVKEFEDLMMYDGEPIDMYLERVLDMVERFRLCGKPKSDDEVISKLLTSLSWPYDEASPVLEEFMSLPDMTLNDLLGLFDEFGDRPVEYTIGVLKDSYKSLKKAKSEQMWCGLCKKYDHNQEDCYPAPRTAVNSTGARQFRGRCHQCGETGHYGKDCNRRNEKPEHLMLAANTGDFTYDEDMWMVYSTTSNHMTPYLKFFTTLDRTYKARVGMANGNVIMVEGKGDVKITMKGVRKVIKNVLFVPKINRNVLSVSQLTSGGYSVEIGGGECTIRDETGKMFANSRWDERGIALRLKVIR